MKNQSRSGFRTGFGSGIVAIAVVRHVDEQNGLRHRPDSMPTIEKLRGK